MRSQIVNAIEAVKLAYLSHSPIAWLVTGDKEVASEIVEHFTIEHYGDFRSNEMGNPVLLKEFSDRASATKEPSIYYLWQGPFESEKDSMTTCLKSLERFITSHLNIAADPKLHAMPKSQLDAVHGSIVIIASPSLPPESWLNKYIDFIYVEALNDDEISQIIKDAFSKRGIAINDSDRLRQLVVSLRGFSATQISQSITRCIISGYFDGEDGVEWSDVFNLVRMKKRQLLDGCKGLKWIDVKSGTHSQKSSSSLNVISTWLNERCSIFEDTEKARGVGYDIPKGVLITGIPGTGKSMMAKVAAQTLDLPLICLDMGDLQEGLVGASEQHMVDALRMVEAMAPCVLWIDEIEKAFSGSSSSSGDGGVMRRMFGKFLTWMQEKTAPCFVFATSNDISQLPPELFRSERFDDKFYSFMPMAAECAAIFSQLIKSENKRTAIFSNELESVEPWIRFLDEITSATGHIAMEGNKWAEGKIPQFKLFTGADISMMVKNIKFRLLRKYGDNATTLGSKVVFEMAKEILKDFMPYGQTNLYDISKCFRKLVQNQFRSASSETVVKFEEYDVENLELSYAPSRYAGNRYNQALYAAVVGAVNFYKPKTRQEPIQKS